MSKAGTKLPPRVAAIVVILSLTTNVYLSGQGYLSPSALVADNCGKTLYIAQATARHVAVFDTKTAKVTATIDVPAEPTGLALTADGAYLYVTCSSPRPALLLHKAKQGEQTALEARQQNSATGQNGGGCVCVIETDTHKIIEQIPAGHGARSPVLDPNGKRLYVCNRFNNEVSVINIESPQGGRTQEHKLFARIGLLREPFAADITPDGKWLYVGNHLPEGPADAESIACKVSVVNTKTIRPRRTDPPWPVSLPNGSTGLHGVAVSPDGRYVYVSHILARYTVPTTQLERGWMNTNALSIINAESKELIDTVLLDDVDYGAANPWGVCCTSDGKYVCVTHAGTDELSIIDAPALLDKIRNHHADKETTQDSTTGQGDYGSYGSGSAPSSNIPNELSFLYGIRQRIKLCGKGPRALAIFGSRVYVAEYFTDSITLVDINKTAPAASIWQSKTAGLTTSLPLGPTPQMTASRRGEMLFHDASLCFQQWQSCASCHPGAARADALNWDLLNDGIGNPKNTKSLLLSHKTPPAMITGVRKNAEMAVRAGIRHIQFAVCPEQDAIAIDEYLKSLKPVPSPYLVNGKLSASAQRGQKIFDKAECASCHNGPVYTDLRQYNVGIGKGLDKDRKFDTPTLVEVWRTAPYLYDGRAATMEEVLTKYNPDDKHGLTSGLSDNQITDLANFVLSQ